ncbi:hypothetical protein ARALYDRAFT_894799 [Arabidopsis lyrata subsp. lyrata]|uniref:Late embryogenesis abundant protein LEA-2 subgroup domain-containing protein n=1 Tax=Arabidopsis lyrata subsp. lyrata TaxID=81972 RepID=D7KXM7_ARALL|nr:uncharacterized protein LOC9323337 [Arabidopsis lyrata subsp. lyrata]EFH63532.1 hypothetical protein ARALYDRAFT_894799 [Arabidopsis lyrata subsp. lyrata]|eukprot:XP_002887273.1 uncharacterized protein LOC9323337 [Arabidopsis lyrata subsp. lyrata]
MGQDSFCDQITFLFFLAYIIMLAIVTIIGLPASMVITIIQGSHEIPVPKIELASMDFTVHNITQTRLSANWDLSIRIPDDLPGQYICLQGDLQASFLYKNVTLATSSPQKYYNLRYRNPQLLTVSALLSDEDISSSIGKEIIEDIKKKKEVQFVSRFSLTDCRKNTTGVMSYVCDEVTLRFEPGSEMKATTVFGNYPNCINI